MEALHEETRPYLCTIIGNLCGIPVRIFEGTKRIFYHSIVGLPVDPFVVHQAQALQMEDHISYYATEHFFFYGIVCAQNTRIVIGPTRQIPPREQELRELAFQADVAPDDVAAFLAGMKSIVHMPLESVMQMLCTINYMLNDEKKTLGDIAIEDSIQQQITSLQEQQHSQKAFLEGFSEPVHSQHNTYDTEQTLMSMIQKGDTAALRTWIAHAPAIRGGVLAPDQLRQRKNTFIVTATLASRAAIRGGLSAEDAFTLSDSYIQTCELMDNSVQLTNLQYHMVLDFTQKVEHLRRGEHPTQLTIAVSNYIQHHMSETIFVDAMAKDLFLSRSHLSRRFKAESGETLTGFILKEKTEEAKRLLRYSDKSLTAIGEYLGFSSSSHFSRVFKKFASVTPGEYRQKHSK